MALVQKLIGVVGLKKQTAKDSLAATPLILGVGVASGKVFSAPITSAYEDITLPGGTTSDRFAPTTNRSMIQPAAAFSTVGTPNLLSRVMLAALGTDVGAALIHTETPGITLPYWAIGGKYGTAPEVTRLNNAKCNTVKLSFDETNNPLMVDTTWLGTTVTPDFTFTTTNDDTLIQPLGPAAGSFQFDLDGTTLAVEPISAGTVEINNNLQGVFLSKLITPDDIIEGEQMIEGVLTVKPINLDGWQNILTGTAAGTTERAAPLFGSFSLTLTNGTQSIVMTANRVEYLTDFPDSDPKGGAAELALAYRVVRPTDGSAAFTAVVTDTLSGVIT